MSSRYLRQRLVMAIFFDARELQAAIKEQSQFTSPARPQQFFDT